MLINKLKLSDFRNYENIEIEFSPDINVITGTNGSGKTNLIEAISILSNLKSFRNVSDNNIVRWSNNNYYCCGDILQSSYKKFEIGFFRQDDKIKKKLKIDGKEIKKVSDYYGRFLSVAFIPSDINIINGSPDIRRKYFDSVISKIYPDYIDELNRFKVILNSRNALLKSIREGRTGTKQLDVWNRLYAEKASYIIKKRTAFIKNFNDHFSRLYCTISSEISPPVIQYKSSAENFEIDSLYSLILQKQSIDIKRGNSSIGPQRDNYSLNNSDSIEFTNYASQGQRRTAAVCLKLSEYEIIKDIVDKKSIIIVDDIFSELDENRRANMIDLLIDKGQLIFTMVNSHIIDLQKEVIIKEFVIDQGKVTSEVVRG